MDEEHQETDQHTLCNCNTEAHYREKSPTSLHRALCLERQMDMTVYFRTPYKMPPRFFVRTKTATQKLFTKNLTTLVQRIVLKLAIYRR